MDEDDTEAQKTALVLGRVRQNRSECSKGEIGEGDERIGTTLMKMLATIQLEFQSAGETTQNAMDAALIRGLEALKKGIELRETGGRRRSIKSGFHEMEYYKRNPVLRRRRSPRHRRNRQYLDDVRRSVLSLQVRLIEPVS